MVSKTKKKSKKLSENYKPGKAIESFSTSQLLGYSFGTNSNPEETQEVPLYAVSWGWNASKRAGNATEVEVREPNMVQRSIKTNYIAASAGKHHSVLISDDGMPYTFGEGRRGQLGIGNPFSDHLGGYIQSFPRQTNPSGELRVSRTTLRDVKLIDIKSGSNFTIGREMNLKEGISSCVGFKKLFEKVLELKNLHPESPTIQKVWSIVRHELFLISQGASGGLFSWGEGLFGELGVGSYSKLISHPSLIPRLSSVRINQVAVGANHVLAIDFDAQVYSWGSGAFGRLGHGDFDNRYFPTLIEYFKPYYVEQCSAGDAHSALLTTSRKITRNIQIKKIVTFGRNGHGRLGNGKTNHSCQPVSVNINLPSLVNLQCQQVVCGGAHTMALFFKHVPISLVRTYGLETYVAAWG